MKKIAKALLFPHIALMIVLLPVSAVFLVYSMVFLGSDSVVSVISYLIASYTLAVWCLKIPRLIRFFKAFKDRNKYAKRWQDDTALRMKVSLYSALIWNTAYALLQMGMGFWHGSFWFFSLAAYYISLAVMRFFLAQHTRRYSLGDEYRGELLRYRRCGVVLLVMNLSISLMTFFMVYWNRTFVHHEITCIALATYTFTSFAFAVVNLTGSRKYNSPAYSAAKAISLVASCVSVLTLASTMLTTFGSGATQPALRKIILSACGVAVSVFIIAMAVYMIVNGTKKLKQLTAVEATGEK